MRPQFVDVVKDTTARHKDWILQIPGVTGIFTGEKTTRGKKTGERSVVVSVEEKKPLSDIPKENRIPAEIDGVPTDVIEEVFRPCSDETRYDPLLGGSSISVTPEEDSSFSSGTAGMIVRDASTGVPMILSCWHVLYGDGIGDDGDVVTNPPYAGGDATPNKVGTNTRYSLSGTVDGAVATVSGRDVSPTILDIGVPTALAAPLVGDVVKKRGKTTGLTLGTVTAIDWSGMIDYGPPVGIQSFSNIIRFEGDPGMVLGGDSGSILVAGATGGGGLGPVIPVEGDWAIVPGFEGSPWSFPSDGAVRNADLDDADLYLTTPTLDGSERFRFICSSTFGASGDALFTYALDDTEGAATGDIAGIQVIIGGAPAVYVYTWNGFEEDLGLDLSGGFDLELDWNPDDDELVVTIDGIPHTYSLGVWPGDKTLHLEHGAGDTTMDWDVFDMTVEEG